ncbi:GNAT family N-acetyltransferase [Pseudonocardia abyssalis]|uniref:GNAT family N-acetyltransferase n=1 Tax=Pseudonocardia abyssalis TaxID=2792008 RepID=A0ABS6UMD9_9PSEU|nr:GNAT family N-acetyltransferase [Pseudonocardia abyssalis]MBW0115925.1 GNAT family N-acetyltransferase [Pseudonocardia abyssalis]MBW0133392.1 GNAT family N-acetyltransferase [Pseudonocardia abyssalis]
MTTAPARHLVEWGPTDLSSRVDEALAVYVAAMGYPPSTARHRRTLWLDHVRRPGWRAVGWLDDADRLLGVAYGYSGAPGQWWYEEVARGLRRRPADRVWLDDYFELTELHVRPDAQGGGLGEGLLRALLAGTAARRVLLSTPEHGERPVNRAWSLYRRTGFTDILRQHRFTGDARPFAVLGRELPLPASGPPVEQAAPPR